MRNSSLLLVALGLVMVGVVASGLVLVFFNNQSQQTEEVVVAATIFPLANIVQNVVGAETKVVQIIPSGASPHSYALTPQQVVKMQKAQVIFAIGHGLDNPITDSAQRVNESSVIEVDEGIELRDFEGGGVDPHYWLTVPNAKKIAATVAREMEKLDPDKGEQYRWNLGNYLEQLDVLEADLQRMAGDIEQRNFVAMHDSWSYFVEQYGLSLAATYEPVEGRQPSVSELKNLGEIVKEQGITVFYAEPQKAATSAVRFLSDEFGLQIRTLDPIGGLGDRNSYIQLMLSNMRTLAAD